jgi:hypothetical protein
MVKKTIKALVFTVFIAPFVMLLVYYTLSFVPYLNDLKTLSMRGQQTIAPVESIVYSLVIADQPKLDKIRMWAIRTSYYNLNFKWHNQSSLKWHLDNFIWFVASYIHFNDREIFGIWVECAFSSCKNDLNSVALSTFGDDLKTLSNSQLADIVAAVKSPKRFAPGSDDGKKRAADILKRANISL